MAVVPMRKILIAGMAGEREALMRVLQQKRLLHLSEGPAEAPGAPDVKEALAHAEKQAQLADSALKVLGEYAPENTGLFASLQGGQSLDFDVWKEKTAGLKHSAALAESILEKNKQIAEASARAARCDVLAESLAPWQGLDMPLGLTETARCQVLIGALPGVWSEEALRSLLTEAETTGTYALELLQGDKTQTPLVLICLKEEGAAIEDALRKKGFARPLLTSDKTPEEALEDMAFEKAAAIAEEEELKAAIRSLKKEREGLQFLYDESRLEADRLRALARTGEGSRSFFISGYVPAARAEGLKEQLESRFTVQVDLLEAEAEEAPPVLLKNNSFSSPTESVVESYGLPGKGELDPTTIMSFFYYFLFGMMLSDAGYGLLMVIGCGIALKKFPQMAAGTKKMLTMFFWCGISTTIWGLLFGSFFGDAIDVIAHTFFGVPADQAVFKSLWFTPLDEPMRLLIYCFSFGLIHLFVGLGLKGYGLLKEKRFKDFLGGVLGWFLLIIGLLLILLPSDMYASIAGAPVPLPSWVGFVAKCMAGAGALLLLFFAAWDKKIGLRLALGAYELYGVTGWLSDVLSYSRLLALGLATGVIASVINTMGTMMGGCVAGAIFFLIVFLLGHSLNMAINLLGAYVHTNRLQFVEFFGKFYEAGGEAFEPLGTGHTKYYHLEEN